MEQDRRQARIAVVGAGWAGLAAALGLAEAGRAVTVYDSAPVPGGRARTTLLDTPLGRFELDNGQHLIVGAYRETLALIRRLGADAGLRRENLALASPSGLSLRAASLPAPLHVGWALLRARGLSGAERLAMLRLIAGLRQARWQVLPGETVDALLRRWRQPARLNERLWLPLCVGALNTVPARACARSFAAVLRDTLGSSRSASDFVLGLAPLGSLLPEPAVRSLRELGARIRLRETVRALRRLDDGWQIATNREAAERYDAVLLALPPWSAARLVASLDPAPALACLLAFEPEPIATAWLFWPIGAAPALPAWSLLDENAALHQHGQWLFDRGPVAPSGAGGMPARVAGVVISVASRLEAIDPRVVADGVARQVGQAFGGPAPAAVRLVTERRATFRCTPGRPRLAPDHFAREAPGLWLAGDWLWPDYPATLESAVRSGRQAAADILAGRGQCAQPAEHGLFGSAAR